MEDGVFFLFFFGEALRLLRRLVALVISGKSREGGLRSWTHPGICGGCVSEGVRLVRF